MNTITDLSVPHALLGAELTLRWRGWGQGGFETPDGRVCAEGALRFAITGSAAPTDAVTADAAMTRDEWALFSESRRYLKRAAGTNWLAEWNDEPGQTAEQVLAVYARARRLAGGAS